MKNGLVNSSSSAYLLHWWPTLQTDSAICAEYIANRANGGIFLNEKMIPQHFGQATGQWRCCASQSIPSKRGSCSEMDQTQTNAIGLNQRQICPEVLESVLHINFKKMEDLSDLSLVDVFDAWCTRCPLPKEHRSIDIYIACPWWLHLDMATMADVWAAGQRLGVLRSRQIGQQRHLSANRCRKHKGVRSSP